MLDSMSLLDALAGLRDLHTEDIEAYTRAILYLFLLILHRREAGEHQDLLRILTQEHTQNQEIVDMADSIIELSEQRGEQRGIEQGIERGAREMSVHNIFTVLSERFSQAEVEPVRDALETVSDLTMLTELFRVALRISSVEAFLQTIDALDV